VRFTDDSPTPWWPVSLHGQAPEVFACALASLSPAAPRAIYCWSSFAEQDEDLFEWHVLAVAGQSLIELHGTGPEGSVEESARDAGRPVLPSALSTARCHRLRDSVVGIRVLDMQRTSRGARLAATDPWEVSWLLELASDRLLTLPEPGTNSPRQIADAERLALAVLSHLQETSAAPTRG